MHGTDPGAHDQRAERQLPGRQPGLTDQPQGKTAGQDRGQQRQGRKAEVVTQIDGQGEREHADKVHRPHTHAHGKGAARGPKEHGTALGGGNAFGQVERGIGGENRYTERNDYECGGIATDEHVTSRDRPPYCFRSRQGKSGDCTDCAKERTDKVIKWPSTR